MALPPSSELTYLSPAGEPLSAPRGWSPAFVELPVTPEQVPNTTVVRNDVELVVVARSLGGTYRALAEWPRSGTGKYSVRVVNPHEGLDRSETVAIAPA